VLVVPVQKFSCALAAERAHDTAINAGSITSHDGPAWVAILMTDSPQKKKILPTLRRGLNNPVRNAVRWTSQYSVPSGS